MPAVFSVLVQERIKGFLRIIDDQFMRERRFLEELFRIGKDADVACAVAIGTHRNGYAFFFAQSQQLRVARLCVAAVTSGRERGLVHFDGCAVEGAGFYELFQYQGIFLVVRVSHDVDFARGYRRYQSRRVFFGVTRLEANRMLAGNYNIHLAEYAIGKPEPAARIHHVRLGAVEKPHAESVFFGVFQIQKIIFGRRLGDGGGVVCNGENLQISRSRRPG